MAKYRKRPVVIEALQWTGENHKEMFEFLGIPYNEDETYGNGINIKTKEGIMRAFEGDYIIKEPFPTSNRKFYPCKPDIFEQTYEPVQEYRYFVELPDGQEMEITPTNKVEFESD